MEALAGYIAEILGAILVALALVVWQRVKEHFDWLDCEECDEIVERWAARGAARLKRLAEEKGQGISLGGDDFEEVVDYVVSKVPKAMEKAGIDRDTVRDMVAGWFDD